MYVIQTPVPRNGVILDEIYDAFHDSSSLWAGKLGFTATHNWLKPSINPAGYMVRVSEGIGQGITGYDMISTVMQTTIGQVSESWQLPIMRD